MTIHYHKYIDAIGLKCPQPLLLAKQGSKQVDVGEVLLLEATDPHTDLDLEVWSQRFGHEIIKTESKEGFIKFWIRIN